MSALAHFGLDESALLGEGGQSRVYALDRARVLRLYRAETSSGFPAALGAFHSALDTTRFPFDVPRIHEASAIDGEAYAIEDRLRGKSLVAAWPSLDPAARSRAVREFMQAAAALHRIRHPQAMFGEILTEAPIRRASWRDFLIVKGEARARENASWLARDVPQLDRALERYREIIAVLAEPAPALVHGDYYGANVLVDGDGAVTAVIDFSPLTLIGDGRLDLVGARHALEALDVAPADKAWAQTFLMETLGEGGAAAFDAYSAYLSLLHSGAIDQVPELYRFCVRTLNALAATTP